MDQMKIGKFIAVLRKEKCLTQEQLGEKLGVTNKTEYETKSGYGLHHLKLRLR